MKTSFAIPVLFGALVIACSSSSTPGAGTGSGAADSGAGTGIDTGQAEAGATGDTWTNYAQGFAATYCVECHGANDAARDYRAYANVLKEKDVIRCGVSVAHDPAWSCSASPAAKQFPISDGKTPPNVKPSDAERTRFVAWLTAGASE